MKKVNFLMLEHQVIKAKDNDFEAKEYILNFFMPFILKTSKHTYVNNMDSEDIKQELITSLMMAIHKYKGNSSFFWYAMQSMKNNIYTLIKKYKRFDKNISLDKVVVLHHEELDENLLTIEESVKLMQALNTLNPNEYMIIFKSFFQQYTYDDIMNETKLKYNTIACTKSKAIKKLKKYMHTY